MSLAPLRRSARSIAACLLVAWMWGLPHLGEASDVCPPAGAEHHDESKHVVTAKGPQDDGGHCAVCHWLRSVHPGLAHRSASPAVTPAGCECSTGSPLTFRDPAGDRLPARAPPTALQ